MSRGTLRDKLSSRGYRYGYDYHGSDPTATSRIRRIGLLLAGRAMLSLKMLTCSGATPPSRVLAC